MTKLYKLEELIPEGYELEGLSPNFTKDNVISNMSRQGDTYATRCHIDTYLGNAFSIVLRKKLAFPKQLEHLVCVAIAKNYVGDWYAFSEPPKRDDIGWTYPHLQSVFVRMFLLQKRFFPFLYEGEYAFVEWEKSLLIKENK